MGIIELAPVPVETDRPPFVPSHALISVQFGVPQILYHQGTDLTCWIDDMGMSLTDTVNDMMGSYHPDGLWVWSGKIRGVDDDAWLEGALRPGTTEEWNSFVKEETIWDHDQMHAYLTWNFQSERKFIEETLRDGAAPQVPDDTVPLQKGHSALVLDEEGAIVAAHIPKMGDDDYVPRGALIVSFLLICPPDELDLLLHKYLPTEEKPS